MDPRRCDVNATPYFTNGQVTLYHGDCREILPLLPRDSVDVVVADPPYGVNWQSGRRNNQLAKIEGDGDEAHDLVRSAVTESARLLREGRHFYIFGRPDLTDLPVGGTSELVWDKEMLGSGDLRSPWGPSWEPITFAVYVSRPSNRARGDGRLAARLRRQSVIRVPRANAGQLEDRCNPHPTPKPVALLRQLIESSSLLGETVLDPFAGGGSTLFAALVEDRRAIGIEIDESYCEHIAKRLDVTGQATLFATGPTA